MSSLSAEVTCIVAKVHADPHSPTGPQCKKGTVTASCRIAARVKQRPWGSVLRMHNAVCDGLRLTTAHLWTASVGVYTHADHTWIRLSDIGGAVVGVAVGSRCRCTAALVRSDIEAGQYAARIFIQGAI